MSNQKQPSKVLRILLWVAQAVLALLFLSGAYLKLMQPIGELAAMMPWTGEHSPAFVRFTGVCDALVGFGLLLPPLLRIKPILAAWAAVGGLAIMIAAIIFHVSRGESSVIGLNIVFAFVAAFVAWGRFRLI